MIIACLVSNFLQIIAFLTGIFYYKRYRSKPTLHLVWFLGITVFTELFNWYALFIDEDFLSFLKGTPFQSNYWLSNIYTIVSFLFYINYFKWYLSNRKSVALLNFLSIVFFVISILEIAFSKGFFTGFMNITNIVGTLLVFLSIAFYYLELLKSDQILQVHKSLPFYVSVGALIFHLCTTPFFIYSSYYSNSIDPDFVNLYWQVIFGTNYLLYSIYIAGFLICSRKKDPYFPKKNF